MSSLRSVLALTLVILLPMGMVADDKENRKNTIDDATFVKKAASSNMAEIKAAGVGFKEATSSEVRRFAQQLSKDHETAQSNLKQAAKSANVEMPTDMLAEHKKTGEMLAKHKGEKEFDAAFLKHMVDSHTKSVELYQLAAKSVKDDNLRKYIDKTLPIVQDHLKMAKKLSENIKDK